MAIGYYLYWRHRLPADSSKLRPSHHNWAKVGGAGQIAIALVGTQGARIGPKALAAVERAGGQQYIAVVFLCEMDLSERDAARQAIPAVFQNRLVVCESDLYPVGLEGRSYIQVEA